MFPRRSVDAKREPFNEEDGRQKFNPTLGFSAGRPWGWPVRSCLSVTRPSLAH